MWSWLGVLVLVALCGCHDPEVDQLTAIKDRVCTCHTSACADQAIREVGAHPVASNRKTQKLAREMLACVARAHDDDRPDDEPAKP